MLKIRPFIPADCDLLFDWRNDPKIRARSFDSRPLDPGAHRIWFDGFLGDASRIGFILEDEDRSVAQIRFDSTSVPGRLRISISTAPGVQGKGYGCELLARACERQEVAARGVLLAAETFLDNQPSIKIFERCHFVSLGERKRGDNKFIEWRRAAGPAFSQTRIFLSGEIEGNLLRETAVMLERLGFSVSFVEGSESKSVTSSKTSDFTINCIVPFVPNKSENVLSVFENSKSDNAVRVILTPEMAAESVSRMVEFLLDRLAEYQFFKAHSS
ncbi:MAG: GNAT family N-acetyltransferase [Candidatus Riflebacteria bacterium]|nr:GNAT family N-acetyltransferase [Candidatus Riflebacteria bacterium]